MHVPCSQACAAAGKLDVCRSLLVSCQLQPSRLMASSMLLSLQPCRRVVEDTLELYTCKPGVADSELPAAPGNGTAQGSYNELATLMTVTGAA